MNSARSIHRGRLVAAVLVSLLIHGAIGYAWLSARGNAPAGYATDNSLVDSPDDDNFAVTLREPEVVRATPQAAADPPQTLPPAIVKKDAAGPGATVQPGTSPHVRQSLGKTEDGRALHGRLKAGRTIVYVLDRSASMGIDGLLPRAVEALKASLEQLGPDVRFQIVAYNSGVNTFAREPLAASPEAISRAARWLSGLIAEGRSNHRAGFREALSCRPDVVFLLTDADGVEDADVRAIAAMNARPARIMAAVFGGLRPVSETPLERLVSITGGSVKYVGP